MKTLFLSQLESHDLFLECLLRGDNTCDTSHVGTGKTVVGCHLALSLKRAGYSVAVICPKSVIPSWTREMKEVQVEPIFVLNYEKIRTGKTKHMSKTGKKIMRWSLPEKTVVLFDEVHKAKGPYTQNAQLLISLIQQGYQVHGMSATAAEDPTEMRGLGYMLGLHSLNKPTDQLDSWVDWMKEFGCYQDDYYKWSLSASGRAKLPLLRKEMYSRNVRRLTTDHFPDSFKKNRVIVEPIYFKKAHQIQAAYREAGATPAIVQRFIEEGTVEDSEYYLVNILSARMLAESFKIPELCEMATDLVAENKSVVVFVNFSETAKVLCKNLKCRSIEGGQTLEERQEAIDRFQNDDDYIIVVNIAAGGTGISLHHTESSNRQRVSLICPSFSAKNHLQTLGRIHRNGAKSDAIQKILVASNTVEEAVIESVQRRIKNLELLHDES